MPREDKWIKILSGKAKPNTKNKEEQEAAQLREAISSYEKDIGLDKISPENSYFRFQQLKKLQKMRKNESTENSAKSFFVRQVAYIKTLVAITAGILIGLTPVLQETVRSGSDSLYSNLVSYLKSNSSTEVVSKEIILEMNEPISESRLITESAISMGMTVIRSEKIEGKEKIQILIIKGFKKFDDKQAEYLKPKLNLEGRDEGNIKLVIRKNKH
jgi:hypothetical protein